MCIEKTPVGSVVCVRERERERGGGGEGGRGGGEYKTTVGCVGALNQNFHLKLLINTLLLRGRIWVDASLQFGGIFAVPVSGCFFLLATGFTRV